MSGSHRRGRSRIHGIQWVLGTMMLVAGLVVGGSIGYFYLRSDIVGRQLIRSFENASQSAQQQSGAAVKSPSTQITSAAWPAGVLALIEAPSIDLVAPVMQGTGDSTLNVAVGHLATSVLMGQPGTSVLAAHDVSWFRHINRLAVGSTFDIVERSSEQIYRIDWKRVVKTGSAISNSLASSVVLEACYPLDALYLTPYRYLVGASLVSSFPIARASARLFAGKYSLESLPTELANQNLTLAANALPMGTLTTVESASPAFSQSNAPYILAGVVTTEAIASFHAIEQQRLDWLRAIVTSVPKSTVSKLFSRSGTFGFTGGFDISETVTNDIASAASAAVPIQFHGGSSKGHYLLNFEYSISQGTVTLRRLTASAIH